MYTLRNKKHITLFQSEKEKKQIQDDGREFNSGRCRLGGGKGRCQSEKSWPLELFCFY